MRTEITKSWLKYALTSEGSLSLHIEDIKNFVIKEISDSTNHQTICRVFETLTGETVDNGGTFEEIESGYKIVKSKRR